MFILTYGNRLQISGGGSLLDMTTNPKWQRKRLEIMARDSWTCQRCGSKEKQLEVHHLVYHENRQYHDYKDNELITLCRDCHQHEHDQIDGAINALVYSVKVSGMLSDEILQLASYHDRSSL